MFLTLRSTATPDFRPWSEQQILLGLRLCCCLRHLRSKKIVSLKPSLQIAAGNRIHGTSQKNFDKNAAHIPRLYWNNCIKRQLDRVKIKFVPPSHAPNWTSCQSYFLAVILSRHVLKIYDRITSPLIIGHILASFLYRQNYLAADIGETFVRYIREIKLLHIPTFT